MKFNYRILVSIFLFLLAGIVFATSLYAKSTFYYVVSGLVIALLVATLIIKLIKSKKLKLFKIISILIAFLVGSLLVVAHMEVYKSKEQFTGEYFVNGRVSERPYFSDDRLVVIVDDACIVNPETLEKTELDGKVKIYLSGYEDTSIELNVGEVITGYISVLRPNLFYEGSPSFYNYLKGVYLLGFASEEDISANGEINYKIFDRLRENTRLNLDKYLSSGYSELAYTMLFGNRNNLDEDIGEIYKASGIAHLLAVSGLHVSFVVLLLSGLLSLLHANDKVKFIIISIVVFLYAMVCNFSVSVVRAMIMTIVLYYMKMRKREYDGLSSLALAGIIILIINPFEVYNLGFRLSFGAVAGIMLLYRSLKAFFNRYFFDKLSSALSLTISATLGTLPFLASSMMKVSVFCIVTNLLVVPIASLAFMILFSVSLIALVIPYFMILAKAFELLMRIVTSIGFLTGGITFAGANQIMMVISSVLMVSFIILVSDYTFYNKRAKIITGSLTCCTAVATLIVGLFL